MKRLCMILAVLALAAGCAKNDFTKWKMQREGDSRSWNVTVPCTIAGALNEAGYFGKGNILEGLAYKDADKSIFDSPWIFSTRFRAAKGHRHVLRFNSLGYSAEISVNGSVIASADTTAGPFCVREFDVTRLVKKSGNKLQVKVFHAPKGSLNHGWVDWNPRPLDETMGILGDVELISTPDIQVQDVFVKPLVDPSDLSHATIEVSATLVNLSDSTVAGTLEGEWNDGGSFSVPVSLDAVESRVVTAAGEIKSPRIWWTWDMGTPEVYTMNVSFVPDGHRRASHEKDVRFGIRSITSEIDEYGHRLFFLNGRPLLLKAAGWTDDIFMQDTPERTRIQAEFVHDMGLNCIRFENIWGKDDCIYDLCDELGLLALVGFSCQWEWADYCGLPQTRRHGCIDGPEAEALAVRYFHDQIVRLRNHPSLIGWLTGSDCIPNERLETAYMELYDKLEYRPYVCSAKGGTSVVTGPSGTKMEGPYEYVAPDYWYVDTQCGGNYGFNTETGVGMNIPQAESLVRMLGKDHLWPLDECWDYHCTASASFMNNTVKELEAVNGTYGEADGFEDFVRKAHALDYDATRAMYEAFRCASPRTTGIVQWMLNSAWPSLYWQLYDWYLLPTAGYYGTKQACNPLQLVYNYKDHCVYTVDEAVPERTLVASMKVYDPDSSLLRSEEAPAVFRAREPEKVFEDIEGPCFLSLQLTSSDGILIADNFYCIPESGAVYDWERADWWGIPIESYPDLRFVTGLPQAEVEMKTTSIPEGFEITLTNKSEVVAYQNILKAKSADGQMIPGILWSDNFISLCPGESKTVRCTLPADCRFADISLSSWNAICKK